MKDLDDKNKLAIKWYTDNYNIHIGDPINLDNDKKNKLFIGSENKRICRFCGKIEPKTTFKKIAHAIPEFLGNHNLITYEECDECNKYFGDGIEQHFAKYTFPQRTISQIIGKNGIPKYETNDNEIKIWIDKIVNVEVRGNACYKIDKENKHITINTKTQEHIPREVYRCLVKMALSLIERSELENFKDAIHWLKNSNPKTDRLMDESCFCFKTSTSGVMPYNNIQNIFFVRKDDSKEVPYFSYLFAYGNCTYQIFIQSIRDNILIDKIYQVYSFPTLFMIYKDIVPEQYKNTTLEKIDLSGRNKVKLDYPIGISYESMTATKI